MGAVFGGGARITSVGTIQGTADGTIAGWFRLGTGGAIRRAMGNHGLFECRTDAANAILHEFLQDGTSISFTMVVGVLYHLAFTWAQDITTKQIFVDGVLNVEDTSATFPTTPGTGAWSIGDRATFGANWIGYLGDVRWYTRRLVPAEIATIFTMRNVNDAIALDDRFHHWPMLEGPELSVAVGAVDEVGTFNLGIVTGSPEYGNQEGTRITRRAA